MITFVSPSSSSSVRSLHTSSNLPLAPQLLTYLLSNPNTQLPHFLHHANQSALTAQGLPSPARVTYHTASTTKQSTAAHRQLKPEPLSITPPKTPEKPLASGSQQSPPDSSTIITDSTPVQHTDPLPDTKRTFFFLNQRTPEQQLDAIQSNPHYLNSIHEWVETLESDDLNQDQQKLSPYLPRLKELLKEGYSYFQNLSQNLARLQATNNQLKEDNNRLSTLPHKDPAFSRLQEDYQKLATQFNELNDEYKYLFNKTQETQALLPGVKNLEQLQSAIKGKIQTESHADQLAGELQASLFEWENVGLALLSTKDGRPPTALEAQKQADNVVQAFRATKEQLEKLRQHHRRLSDSITQSRPATMADNTTHATGMIQGENFTPGNIRTIWEQIPEEYRQLPSGQKAPTNIVDLLSTLGQIQCQHPRQLAQVLGDETGTQDWDTSLVQVDEHCNHQCPEPVAIPASASRLFKSSDVPTFKDDKDYDGFRGSLVAFLQSEDTPQRSDFGRALLRILSSIEAPSARVAAKNWNVQNLLRPTWEATYQQFLEALDKKFESQTILQDSKIAWMACRPKESEKPSEFFNRFEGLTSQLQDVQRRKNAPVLSDSIITERLLLILPRYLTNNARIHFAQQGRLMELQTPEELRKYFEVTWTYTPRPAATGHDTKSRFKTANASPAPANASPNNVKERQCGIIASYDTYPSVPNEARGSLMPDPDPAKSAVNAARRHYCAQRKLCLFCRRPQSEHQASAPRFKPVTLQGNARPAPAQIHAPTPEQFQIEAAPLLDL